MPTPMVPDVRRPNFQIRKYWWAYVLAVLVGGAIGAAMVLVSRAI
jgi:glycerol uptake facilitator-like aquaporin